MLTRLKQLIVTKVIDPAVAALPASARWYLANHALRDEAREVLRWLDRENLASLYLEGDGIEIGGLNAPLKVPRRARVKYVDYASGDELRRLYPELSLQAPDIVDDGSTLATLRDDSLDFVVAMQMIEHLEDPVGAVKNWLRVLKTGGILFVAFPDKACTFDCGRPVTPVAHLIEDHERGPAASRLAHFSEFYRVVLGVTDEQEIRRREAAEHDVHFHVWDVPAMLEFVVGLRRYGLDFELLAFASYGEGAFVLQKGARDGRPMAEASLRHIRGMHARQQ